MGPRGRPSRDVWEQGAAYEAYIGRWSLPVARELVRWLDAPRGRRWLDVGCGSGTLVSAILASAHPSLVVGIDRSAGFARHAAERLTEERACFLVGDAQGLPLPADAFDLVVSGLVMNFVPDATRMVGEMRRVARRGGSIALYVWDYAAGMEMLRRFWEAAKALDPDAAALDEGLRFPTCAPGPLEALFVAAGLTGVVTRPIDVPTPFRDFEDYWSPFLGGQGPAPTYVVSLPEDRRSALRERMRSTLPVAPDGSISLTARAWAVSGTR